MVSAAGHQATLSFGLEDTFADGGGTPQPFGYNANLTTAEGSNNLTRLYEPTSRDASNKVEGRFEGSFSVEFVLTNPFWLPTVLGGGDGTYDSETPQTMTIYTSTPQYDRALLGCAVSSATISVATDDTVTVTLDGDYADEDTTSVTQPMVQHEPMAYHDGEFTVGGTTYRLVQEVELSIENNTDLPGEVGTRFGVDFSPKQREFTVDYTEIVNKSDNVTDFYGGTTPSADIPEKDVQLPFENGAGESITFSGNAAASDTFSPGGIGDPEADLDESITLIPNTVTATAAGGYFSA